MTTSLTFYGHATLGLETDGYKLIVDPSLEGNPAARVSASDVSVEYILVTHGHGDHISDVVSIAKRTGATAIANFEIATWLSEKGVETHAQHIGGGFRHPFGYLKMTFASHGSALPDGANGGMPGGFLLTTNDGLNIYIAGDTGLFSDMQIIGEIGLDLAVLPIGDNFTMGPDDALRAVKYLRPKNVIPYHYNTWPVIEQDAHTWAERVHAETESKVKVMSAGDSIEL
jgi:L-ascorbate metabolism protein UlaG (beta-lactamase superfamily)